MKSTLSVCEFFCGALLELVGMGGTVATFIGVLAMVASCKFGLGSSFEVVVGTR